MKRQYITSYQIVQSGEVIAKGNQSLTIECIEPPDANEFFKLVVADAKKRSGLDHGEVHITGVLKL